MLLFLRRQIGARSESPGKQGVILDVLRGHESRKDHIEHGHASDISEGHVETRAAVEDPVIF